MGLTVKLSCQPALMGMNGNEMPNKVPKEAKGNTYINLKVSVNQKWRAQAKIKEKVGKSMRIAKLPGRLPFLEFLLKRLFCEGARKRADSHSIPAGGGRAPIVANRRGEEALPQTRATSSMWVWAGQTDQLKEQSHSKNLAVSEYFNIF